MNKSTFNKNLDPIDTRNQQVIVSSGTHPDEQAVIN